MSKVSEFIDGVHLPTMPEVATSLIKTLNDEDTPFERVANAIRKDPALTAKLIRLANSARFGLSRKISSIDDAITMVGLSQVRTLALAACMSTAFPTTPGLNREEIWKESMACAGYAHWLTRAIGGDAQQAWLTGFMVRLGEIIMAQKSPQLMPQIEQLPHHPGGRWEREESLLGFSECQVSAELAKAWQFPAEVVAALMATDHPMETKPFNKLAAVIHIAELLAEIGVEEPRSAKETIEQLPKEVLQALQIQPDWMEAHLPDIATLTDTQL
jgi:HD-like signal output (HDOD) protein